MTITYTRVTWYSQIIAIILFVAVFFAGLFIGESKTAVAPANESVPAGTHPMPAAFGCPQNKTIAAMFYDRAVRLILSDGRELTVPQTISASGARYANADESFVFWNKGSTAFITENGTTTYGTCIYTIGGRP